MRVEAWRIALGLDKRELAHLIGVSPPTLQQWIDGKIEELALLAPNLIRAQAAFHTQ